MDFFKYCLSCSFGDEFHGERRCQHLALACLSSSVRALSDSGLETYVARAASQVRSDANPGTLSCDLCHYYLKAYYDAMS